MLPAPDAGSGDRMISIIVPVFNEAPTLEILLGRVEAVPIDKEILLIDDGSIDGSTDIIRSRDGLAPYRVFYNDRNMGKGYCVRHAIGQARGDVIVFQDADLEYTPSELPMLTRPILDGHADVVYGARFIDPAASGSGFMHAWHVLGNRMLTQLSNLTTGLNLNDMETCYKMFRSDIIKSIDIETDDFGSEVEITAKIARIPDIRVHQMPISYHPRSYSEGKKINWKDGLLAVWYIARFGLRRQNTVSGTPSADRTRP